MWSVVVEDLLWPITRYILTCLKFTKNVKWHYVLRRRHFLLNYSLVIRIIAPFVWQYEWRCMSLYRWLEEVKNRSLARRSLLWSFLIAGKHPHNTLPSCCCSMLVQKKNLFIQLHVSLNELRHAVHFKIAIVLFLGSGSVSNSWGALCFRLAPRSSYIDLPDYENSARNKRL